MIRVAALLLLVLAALPAGAVQHADLSALGVDDTVRRFHTQPTLDLTFGGRIDQVAGGGRLRIELDPAAAKTPVRAIEVRVNDEPLATLRPQDRREETLAIDANLLGDRNVIRLRLVPEEEGACGEVAAGTWAIVRGGSLETWGTPLPLPNDLSVLPLPFYDRGFDRLASVPVVLPELPTVVHVRLGALVAGFMGADAGLPLELPVSLGALPESHAVVLVDGAASARALGLPVPEGPSIRMADHPGGADRRLKLLILAGRNVEELELAVQRLAAGFDGLAGEMSFVGEAKARAKRTPWDAPIWAKIDAPLRFDAIVPDDRLVHRGSRGGAIALRFHLPPDLHVWPDAWIDLDIGARTTLPEGVAPPRLDVELNGHELGALPAFERGAARARLRVPRDVLRGSNELLVHVRPAEMPRACAAAGDAEGAEVRLLPDSALHVERLRHLARLPDVAAFARDGHPFTRLADLSETAAVLAPLPSRESISTLLSLVAHFGSITGDPGARIEILSAYELPHTLDKDLLLVGTPAEHPLLVRWSGRFPLAFERSGAVVRMPEQTSDLLALLAGGEGRLEHARAKPIVAGATRPAAVMAMESPLARGRVALAVTAAEPADLPIAHALANSSAPPGDLLVIDGESLHAFRIGPVWHRGALPLWTRLQLLLSEHPVLLVGLLLLGAAVFAWPLRRSLERRAARRLQRLEPAG